jgi:hypothetical protein
MDAGGFGRLFVCALCNVRTTHDGDLVTKLPVMLGGSGLAGLGAKVDDATTKPSGAKAAGKK